VSAVTCNTYATWMTQPIFMWMDTKRLELKGNKSYYSKHGALNQPQGVTGGWKNPNAGPPPVV
jgi:hypothetical protein